MGRINTKDETFIISWHLWNVIAEPNSLPVHQGCEKSWANLALSPVDTFSQQETFIISQGTSNKLYNSEIYDTHEMKAVKRGESQGKESLDEDLDIHEKEAPSKIESL